MTLYIEQILIVTKVTTIFFYKADADIRHVTHDSPTNDKLQFLMLKGYSCMMVYELMAIALS